MGLYISIDLGFLTEISNFINLNKKVKSEMKNNKKKVLGLLTLVIICLLLTISNNSFNGVQINNERSVETRNEIILKSPKKSGSWNNFSFIHIDGNWSTAAGYEWCSGDGSWGNPYIIENMTIDASTSPTGSGIVIDNSKNEYFIIRNCTVYNSGSVPGDAGIKLENTNNGTLINNNCSNNPRHGILLNNYCDNNTLSENTVNVNLYGIQLNSNCDNNNLSGNTVNDNLMHGIYLYDNCNDTIISGNTINGNTQYGIYLRQICNDNTISGNTANDNDNGIVLSDHCDDNFISGNTANDNGDYGIYLYDNCNNNTISGNTVKNTITSNQEWGIRLETGCNDNTISGNTANYNDKGIGLSTHCDDNFISGNTANDNDDYGIYLYANCNNNTISGNTASNVGTTNQNYGIYLDDDCDDNTVSGILIKDNQIFGIYITGSNCENNLIYANCFIGNGLHAIDDGTNNQWNNSVIGNYWDDHTSPDSNNDGIVDTPYTWITGSAGSEDSFPLVESPIHLGEKIYIDDLDLSAWNWSQTAKLKVWCSGSGIDSDPYIIDGLNINGGGSGSGIIIGNSSVYFTIQSCTIYNTGSVPGDAGIKLENTNNGALIDNNCSNNFRHGILLHNYCDNNTLSGNTVNVNLYGIQLSSNCDNNTLSGNTVNDNLMHGIYLYDNCNDTLISGNTVNDNIQYGIVLRQICNDNIISGNIANDNDFHGIFLWVNCDNNTISGNIIVDNPQLGMELFSGCDNNLIYGNNFTGNGLHTRDDGTNNQWNNSITGNYWDNYTGVDADDDGIGDTPYNIPGLAGAKDYFPIWDDGPEQGPSPSPGGGGGGGGGGDDKGEEEAIPGYNIFILIGAVCLISVILVIKRLNLKLQD